jgi:uncharacterized damage-inducible protein DinB
MTTDTTPTAIIQAAADVDAALARLQRAVEQLGDGDLARAPSAGGWSLAQVISHLNVCTLIWLGDLHRLAADPDLTFFFREEVGHDAVGYPPPTVEVAARQLAATRRTLATTLPATPPEVLARVVEIPDLGTMTIADWTPLIVGHLVGHVEQAFAVMHDRNFAPAGF